MNKPGTPIVNRLTANMSSNVGLATYAALDMWKPKVGDFVVYHGWFSHSFGVVSYIDKDEIMIIESGLPKLLFTMPEHERSKSSRKLSISKIKSSRGGAYSVLQGTVWHIDD